VNTKIQDISKEICGLKKINSEIDEFRKKRDELNIDNFLDGQEKFKPLFAEYLAISEQIEDKEKPRKSLLHIIRREIWIGSEYKIYLPNEPFYIGEYKIEIIPDAGGFPFYFIIDDDNRNQYLFFEDDYID
jgi:uncharacterized coiled-coil DUF342 family protein